MPIQNLGNKVGADTIKDRKPKRQHQVLTEEKNGNI
jgi:hypothetical protein